MFKCGIVLGGLAAATILGSFAAGPALASTGSQHRIPVVTKEAALAGAAQPDPGAPGGLPEPGSLPQLDGQTQSGDPSRLGGPGGPSVGLLSALAQPSSQTGIVPAVGGAVGSLLTALGLPDVGALIGGTSATQNPGGPLGALGGLLAGLNGQNGLPDLSKLLNGSNGLPDLSKLLNGQNGLPDLGKLLNGQNGQPDLGKLVGLLVMGKILGDLGGSNPLGDLLNGQNGPNLLGGLLNAQNGPNSLGNLLSGQNGLYALGVLGNLLNSAKLPIGG